MQIASKQNYHMNTFKKLYGLFLQACGTTDIGLGATSKLGDTLGPRRMLDVRTDLAVHSEEQIKEHSKKLSIAMVIDNLDRKVKHVLQHQTLPVLLCKDVQSQIKGLSNERKTVFEAIDGFTLDFFLMNSPGNTGEKEAFMEVTKTVLANLCKSLNGCKIVSKLFPFCHDHPLKEVIKRLGY